MPRRELNRDSTLPRPRLTEAVPQVITRSYWIIIYAGQRLFDRLLWVSEGEFQPTAATSASVLDQKILLRSRFGLMQGDPDGPALEAAHRPGLAVSPGGELAGQLRDRRLDAVCLRRRLRPLRDVAGAVVGQACVVGATGHTHQLGKLRDRPAELGRGSPRGPRRREELRSLLPHPQLHVRLPQRRIQLFVFGHTKHGPGHRITLAITGLDDLTISAGQRPCDAEFAVPRGGTRATNVRVKAILWDAAVSRRRRPARNF